jgi:hypothetical protein
VREWTVRRVFMLSAAAVVTVRVIRYDFVLVEVAVAFCLFNGDITCSL